MLALVLASSLLHRSAAAHPLAPALLELREHGEGRVDVSWKTPLMRVRGTDVRPSLPEGCSEIEPPTGTEDADSVTIRWAIDCGEQGLTGRRVGVLGLEGARTDALLRIELADGRLIRTVARAATPFVEIKEGEEPDSVFWSYMRLGFEHILEGLDHLAFVFGLLLLAATTRLLIETITAFTVGHSVTLSLAALGIARVPSGPVEILIAFSIFLLAVELTRDAGAGSLLRRFPWVMSFGFGLLHGLGFAGALREIGLPSGDVPMALFSFNVGIELGQLAFVFAVLAAQRILQPALTRLPTWTARVPVYGIGVLSVYWVLQRALGVG